MGRRTPTIDAGLDRLREMARGNYSLAWMESNPEGWGQMAVAGPAGIGLVDIEVDRYAEIPEHASPRGGVALRGSHVPGKLPAPGYDLNERSRLWSNCAAKLYDEAVARQWNSVTDVPWDQLQELPEDLEKALCQMCTGIAEFELAAADATARWISRINGNFHEIKLFLATQLADQARHMDVFRKRALANGGGLLETSPCQHDLLLAGMRASSYTTATALMQILCEGFSLSLFHAGEFLAPGEVEKTIFRLCMQDQARHVAHAVSHLQCFLEDHPEGIEEIHRALDAGEQAMFRLTLEPQTIEPRAILAGAGLAGIDLGLSRVALLYARQVREYLGRLGTAGLDRAGRITIPVELPVQPCGGHAR